MVKISYAICVCNEHREVESLLNFLLKVKDAEDEINILVDSGKVTLEVRTVLESYGDKIVVNELHLTENSLNIETTTRQSALVTISLRLMPMKCHKRRSL